MEVRFEFQFLFRTDGISTQRKVYGSSELFKLFNVFMFSMRHLCYCFIFYFEDSVGLKSQRSE
jgi:hypothetical protein